MKKGMGRSAAVLAMSSAASVALTFGPGLAAAHAFDDKDQNPCSDKKDDGWDSFGDKDGKDGVDGNKDGAGNKDGKDGDWFNWDDKDKDKNKNKNCPVGGGVAGVGVGVLGGGVGGVGGGAGGGAGGVAAGGGGMADHGSSPLLPLAGATVGALLIGAGVARRRAQGAA